MTELLDSSFTRIPDRVREVRPQPPRLLVQATTRRAQVAASPAATQAEPQRLVLQASPPPVTRPAAAASTLVAAAPKVDLTEALRLAGATAAPAAPPGVALASSQRPRARPGSAAPAADAIQQALATAVASDDAPAQQASLAATVLAGSARPAPSPRRTASIAAVAQPEPAAAPTPEPQMQAAPGTLSLDSSRAPKPRSETVILAAMGEGDLSVPEALEVVRRPTDSGRNWGVSLGRYTSQAEADRLLLRLALQDGNLFGAARRHVANTNRGFEPQFGNLSKGHAELACERMQSRSQPCQVITN